MASNPSSLKNLPRWLSRSKPLLKSSAAVLRPSRNPSQRDGSKRIASPHATPQPAFSKMNISHPSAALDNSRHLEMIPIHHRLHATVRVPGSKSLTNRALLIASLANGATGLGGKIPANKAELFIGNSGTTARFLSAFLTLGNGEFILDGEVRMRERPIGDLVSALAQLGAKMETTNNC